MSEKCILCGNEGRLLYSGLKDRLGNDDREWSFLRCAKEDCGLIWLAPRPGPEEVEELYPENYYTHEITRETVGRKLIQKAKKSRIGKALGFYAYLHGVAPGRLLDVGCGSGYYLNEMRELGWRVEGLDPDEHAVRVAQEIYGLKVNLGTLEDIRLESDSFDVITVNHVLEHVLDPVQLIQECNRILKPNGLLLVSTPNYDSLGHRIFRDRWLSLDVPRHLYLFSEKNLKEMARSCGFGEIKLETAIRGAREVFLYGLGVMDRLREMGKLRILISNLFALAFTLVEYIGLSVKKVLGEELILMCRKDG